MANKAKNDTSANSPNKSAHVKKGVSRNSSRLDKNCGEEQRATRTKIQEFCSSFEATPSESELETDKRKLGLCS
ncbi:unnamed protein product [Phytophthora lilii]|uniref:Unnamed protein product n=1 Tax=Phytophthora lilii TaxID=2077276 RepID=A0A9W6WRN9_9STRA|nr:unnamed protein product [Phytophthora lilii]